MSGISSLDYYVKDYSMYFIQPMNLCEPTEDFLGYVKVCALNFSKINSLTTSSLNHPFKSKNGLVLPSLVVRLWSRSSSKYLSILESNGAVYARTPFGPVGHFRLILEGDYAFLQSTKNPNHHLAIIGQTVTGQGVQDEQSKFRILQDRDGFSRLESLKHPGMFVGVRKNGNIMTASQVDANCHCAHFVVQKEAEDIVQ